MVVSISEVRNELASLLNLKEFFFINRRRGGSVSQPHNLQKKTNQIPDCSLSFNLITFYNINISELQLSYTAILHLYLIQMG